MRGNLEYIERPNDVVTRYEYDDLYRLLEVRHFADGNGDHLYDVGERLVSIFTYDVRAGDGRRIGTDEQFYDTTGTLIQSNTFTWTYDNDGRLTQETYDTDGTAGDYVDRYEFDLVGNRLKKEKDSGNADDTSFVADEGTTYAYDKNDRLLIETYDDLNIGSGPERTTTYEYGGASNPGTRQTKKTETEGGVTKTTSYDYNATGRMSRVTIDETTDGPLEVDTSYTYNDAGFRVSETDELTSATKLYLVDANNHTGYAQILEELDDQQILLRSYLLAHDVLSQFTKATATTLWLIYDGHGSTRGLVDATGQPLTSDIYTYSAYGELLGFTGTPKTAHLYSGEWRDLATGLDYLRSRWYDLLTGRFNRVDDFFGNLNDPQSLHKYLYGHANPVLYVDPSGLLSGLSLDRDFGNAAHAAITKIYKKDHLFDSTSRSGRWTRLGPFPKKGERGSLYKAKVDLLNRTTMRYGEIKPLTPSGVASGITQMYLREEQFGDAGTLYAPDVAWTPSTNTTQVRVGSGPSHTIVFVNVKGLVFYTSLTELKSEVLLITAWSVARTFTAGRVGLSASAAISASKHLASARVTVDNQRLNQHVGVALMIATLGVTV